MSLSFYKKSTLYLFVSYLILQVLICYLYGGWLIANLLNLDGYYGYAKIFFISTDISILLAAIISLSSFLIFQLRLIAKFLTAINMLTYIGIVVYDFIYPPPTLSELLLYTLSSLMIIVTYIFYEVLVNRVQLKEE